MLSSTRRVSAFAAAALVTAVLAVPALSSPAAATVPDAEPGCTIGAPVTVTNTTAQALANPGTVQSSVTVSATGPVAWVRVQTHIKHTYPGQVKVTLVSPSGQRVILTYRIADGYDDVFDGTWWEDDAGGASYDAEFVDGEPQPLLAPLQALGNFRGTSAQGDWTLEVTDISGGDTGSLDAWTLELATYTGAAPSTTTVAGTPGTGGPVGQDVESTFTSDVTTSVVGTVEGATVTLDASTDPVTGGYIGIDLVSPSGTRVRLTTDGWADEDYGFDNTTFADDGVDNGTAWYDDGAAYDNRRIAPLEPFAAYRGEPASGQWKLVVVGETYGPVEMGDWSLELTIGACGQDTRLAAAPATGRVTQGGTVTYSVTAGNDIRPNAVPVTGAQATMTVPAGMQLVSAAASQGTCAGPACTLGALANGATATVTYTLKATSVGVARPTVMLTQAGGDVNPADNTTTFSTTVDALPDTTKPVVALKMKDRDLAKVAAKGVKVRVKGSEAGTLELKLRLPAATAEKLGLERTIGRAVRTLSDAGTLRVTLKVARKNRAALAGSEKPVKLLVKGVLTDAAGNKGKDRARHSYAP